MYMLFKFINLVTLLMMPFVVKNFYMLFKFINLDGLKHQSILFYLFAFRVWFRMTSQIHKQSPIFFLICLGFCILFGFLIPPELIFVNGLSRESNFIKTNDHCLNTELSELTELLILPPLRGHSIFIVHVCLSSLGELAICRNHPH